MLQILPNDQYFAQFFLFSNVLFAAFITVLNFIKSMRVNVSYLISVIDGIGYSSWTSRKAIRDGTKQHLHVSAVADWH